MLTVVVAGGEFEPSARALAAAAAADLVIAADSGARHLAALGRGADVLLGDFDSFRPAAAVAAATVLTFPTAKDQTDTHLAVRVARARGATRVVLLGALRGPRLDHGAANTLLLAADEFRGLDLRAIDGLDELRAVRNEALIEGNAADLVTLLALTRTAGGVTTAGLIYPLTDAVLRRGDSRGVSNELAGERAEVRVRRGVLLLAHRAGGDPNRLP